MTNLPPPDEPDIYEGLINALIAASTAHREASERFQVGLPYVHRAFELHEQVRQIVEESNVAWEESTELLLEAVGLVQADPQGNIVRAMALSAQASVASRRARAISEQTTVLMQQASAEFMRGMEVWNEGSESLRVGLERATTLLQSARRRETNGDNPDALTA